MKKVIDGKLYNTETAVQLASYWNGVAYNDFRCLTEELYRTPRGRFFVYGHGGAMTKYAEKHGDCYTDGEAITPLTQAAAKAWTEEHANEKYTAIFDDVEEA